MRHTVACGLLALTMGWTGCDDRTGSLPLYLQSECEACEEGDDGLCLDGVDSDEDGLTDCDDPDCAWVPSCPWEGAENTDQRCHDGLDNDDNGFTDCQDWECSATTWCSAVETTDENTTATCTNGVDDDGDGYIDCKDWDCDDICQ